MPQRRRSESGAIIGLLARLEAPTSCLAANDVEGQQQKIQSARSFPCAPPLLERHGRAFRQHHVRDIERH